MKFLSLLGLALTIVFELVQSITSVTLVARLSLPERTGGIVAAVAVALLLAPLHGRLRARTDRLLKDQPSAGTQPVPTEPAAATAPAAD